MLGELEMQVIRTQMNPHFIFNSLNSIDRFILQNNRADATAYLTKFSRLVRMILQNSKSSLITIEQELISLDLYLELESLRFDGRFNYKIKIDQAIDLSILKIPPLIIQPFVENAVWHGLMPKEITMEVLSTIVNLTVGQLKHTRPPERATFNSSGVSTKNKRLFLAMLHELKTKLCAVVIVIASFIVNLQAIRDDLT